MINYCEHHKRIIKNGITLTSRCIKYNHDINDNNLKECFQCRNKNKSEEIPEQALNQNEKPMSRKELFEALSSTLGIIAEQMEEFDKRIKKLEDK